MLQFLSQIWFLSCSFIHDSADHAVVIKRICHGKNPPQNIFMVGEKNPLGNSFCLYHTNSRETQKIKIKNKQKQKGVAYRKTQNMK